MLLLRFCGGSADQEKGKGASTERKNTKLVSSMCVYAWQQKYAIHACILVHISEHIVDEISLAHVAASMHGIAVRV